MRLFNFYNRWIDATGVHALSEEAHRQGGKRSAATGTFANNRNTWKNEDRAGWLVVLAAFLGVMVSFGSLVVFTFSVFLKPLGSEFGWSREGISPPSGSLRLR